MRTTLDIEDDILQAAKELARAERSSTGKVISSLARKGLNFGGTPPKRKKIYRNGVPILASRGEVITLEHVQRLMDEEGI